MKILYIHQFFLFPDNFGGTRSYDLAKKFVEKGYQVTILTTSAKFSNLDTSKRWNQFERDGIQFWVLTCDYSQLMPYWRRNISFFKFMIFSLFKSLSLKVDCVLATSPPLSVAFPAIIKKQFSKCKLIYEVRDVWPQAPIELGALKNPVLQKIALWLESWIYKKADFIVPLSDGMKNSIVSRHPHTQTKCFVIPNISEIERFQYSIVPFKLPIDEGIYKHAKIVLYAGTIGFVNGIDYLVRLAEGIHKIDENIHFWIFGRGTHKEKSIELASKLGILNRNIFFFDPVPKNSLPYLYNLATVGSSFVIDIPVMLDNCANKFFDTFASGRPIVINYEGWQADAIRKYNIGFLLPKVLNDHAIGAFYQYITNEDLLEEQKKNAINAAVEQYSLDIAVNKYISVFNRI
jgi:glycosyltransferase involved in cell wall biosynthesis